MSLSSSGILHHCFKSTTQAELQINQWIKLDGTRERILQFELTAQYFAQSICILFLQCAFNDLTIEPQTLMTTVNIH